MTTIGVCRPARPGSCATDDLFAAATPARIIEACESGANRLHRCIFSHSRWALDPAVVFRILRAPLDWNQGFLDSVATVKPSMEKLNVERWNIYKFAASRSVWSGP